MLRYEELEQEAVSIGIHVAEDETMPEGINGVYLRDKQRTVISVRRSLPATKKACILAEELGHHKTAFGDARQMDSVLLARQEAMAMAEAVATLIPPQELEQAVLSGSTEIWEMAERLGVTEDFLRWTLAYYQRKDPQLVYHLQVQTDPAKRNKSEGYVLITHS